MANVLAVFAHPDDEVLGAGGTLAKHAQNGDRLAFAFGCTERNEGLGRALDILGHDGVFFQTWGQRDQDFERLDYTISELARWGNEFDPDVIYTHHPGDLNADHEFTARAVLTAFRPKPGEKARAIYACEVPSSTEYTYPREFQPNHFVALTPQQLDKKVAALKCYESEIQEFPHPRSAIGVRNVAAVRGQEVGVEAAEAFQLLRRVA